MKATLDKIVIEKQQYGERKGKYNADVTVATDKAQIKLAVSEDFVNAILKKCASELINELNRSAYEFTNDIALAAGLEIDVTAIEPESSAFKLLM